jgi:hypothetical protein
MKKFELVNELYFLAWHIVHIYSSYLILLVVVTQPYIDLVIGMEWFLFFNMKQDYLTTM